MLVLTAILWSSGGLLVKSIDWNPLAIAGARSGIAAVIIRIAFYRSTLTWSSAQIWGALGYTGTVLLFVSATKLTTAANAIVLQYTAPIYVALLGSWLLKEKATLRDWVTVCVVMVGMVLFFLDRMSAGGLVGNLLAVASGFTLALMVIAMRRQKEGAPFGSALLGNIITFCIGFPFMFSSSPGTKGWVAIVILGCFQLGLAYVLYSLAIKHVKALEATIITIIEPILNPVWVFLAVGEAPGPWSLVGGVVIIAALIGRYVFATTPFTSPIQEEVDNL